MKLSLWLKIGLFITALSMAGCNLFNPSGEGDPGDTNLNEQGQIYFQRGQYQKAMDAFSLAIAKDSSNSMAYYGYAKSAVALYQLDKIKVLDDVEAMADDQTQISFLNHPDSILTSRLQAASRVRLILGLLTDRDTLTQYFKYLSDSSAGNPANDNYDTLFAARRAFMEQYILAGDVNTPGYRKRGEFPLTDFRMPYANVIVDYLAFNALYTFTRLYDLNGDNIINERDAMMKLLDFNSDSGFAIGNLSSISDSLENDTTKTQDLNNLVAAMKDGLLGTGQLSGLIGGGTSEEDSGSTEAQTSSNVDSLIASMGDAIMFYQFGDKIDNDGDGCIDEEIMDEKDNDLDGFVDEDARVIPFTKPDGVDNDLDGFKDPVNPPFPLPAGTDASKHEELVGDSVSPTRPHILGFVHAYLVANPADNDSDPLKVRFIKIKKGAPADDMAVRLAVQKDSLLTKRLPNGKIPASLGTKLATFQQDIGGCWRNLEVEAP